MHEINLNSLSLFVGTGQCNANCSHCAGKPLRKYAPKEDGVIDEALIERTIKKCYILGARYLSISSSGEPTLSPLSVTKTLELISKHKEMGFSPINLYSNGIRIGEDKTFSDIYLPLWKNLNLTTIYVTVHDMNEKENARNYGIENYPSLDSVFSRIHQAGLLVRANLVLSKKMVGDLKDFILTIKYLEKIGVDYVSAWSIRNQEDQVDKNLSPLEEELDRIENWIEDKPRIKLLREKSKIAYQTGQKLTLFPDGTLSNSWCNH